MLTDEMLTKSYHACKEGVLRINIMDYRKETLINGVHFLEMKYPSKPGTKGYIRENMNSDGELFENANNEPWWEVSSFEFDDVLRDSLQMNEKLPKELRAEL